MPPAALAAGNVRLERSAPLAAFPRLAVLAAEGAPAEAGEGDGGAALEIDAVFAFESDIDGRPCPTLRGRIDARLPAICQRCLEPMTIEQGASVARAFVRAGAAVEVPGCEPWELEGEEITPAEVLEEELMLALPLAPVHARPKDCGPIAALLAAPETAARGQRPFEDLRRRLAAGASNDGGEAK